MPAIHTALAPLLSLAVHELRTPVTVTSGYLRMLLKEQGGPLTDRQRRMLEEAERACTRLSALVAEMGELGRMEGDGVAWAQEPVDISAMLRTVAADMQDVEGRPVSVPVRGVDSGVMVTGDRARLEAALRTLLRVTLREHAAADTVVASVVVDETSASVCIVLGDEDAQPRLLAPEARQHDIDAYRGGTGLALPLALRTLAAHGGSAWGLPGPAPRAGCACHLPVTPPG